MALDETMPTFARLSYGERWRVILALRRGRAPQRHEQALAAIEYAGAIDTRRWARIRLFLMLVTLLALVLAIYAASRGDGLTAVANGLYVAVSSAAMLIGPQFWPGAVAHSVAESRALVEAQRR